MGTENENDERPAPLPTRGIARRKSADQLYRNRSRRLVAQDSLATFTSRTSFGSGSDPGRVVEVGNLRFLSDDEARGGRGAVLGRGAFATVRLARRLPRAPIASRESLVSNLTDAADFGRSEETLTAPDCVGAPRGEEEGGALVAVKIFEKSVLRSSRTVERDAQNQTHVRTAFEQVEREIAVMKKLRHPNLVSLIDVVDTRSNRLYMVLEYLPLGEIMTNVPGTGTYKRRPRRDGERELSGVTADGHFDERHAALYFVDIMHGLAHLHKNRIVHRDLKPENILLDSKGVAKLGDLGVAHLFEDERPSITSLSLDNLAVHNEMDSAKISRSESQAALMMKSMADTGKLTRTEGTWAFWSPEMCEEESLVFSGYSSDVWAAGICLYIFATGKLPFYSEIPLDLFGMIAAANIELDHLKLSDALVGLLKTVLAKDPGTRAGVGDCLKHPFCNNAREQRLKELGEDVENLKEVIVQQEDIQQAFTKTQRMSLKAVTSGLKKQLTRRVGRTSVSNLRHWRWSENKSRAPEIEGEESTGERRRSLIHPRFRRATHGCDDPPHASADPPKHPPSAQRLRRSTFCRSSALFSQRGSSQ